MPRRRPPTPSGQASVELVALLPALALVGLACWWIVAGALAWSQASGAARAGARAAEVGAPAAAAARGVLPAPLARRARVEVGADGRVGVHLRVPRPAPFLPTLTVSGSAAPPGAAR
jgi:hypothetical protein